MGVDLGKFSEEELIALYAEIPRVLRERGVIRTKNFLGDLGEYLVIKHYNGTSGLPKLQMAPAGTQNVDALSRKGERYSIKATSRNGTGVFNGLNDKNSQEIDQKRFEFVIIVQFDSDYKLRRIIELDWQAFLKHKRWHSTMRAWSLGISKSLLSDSKIIFDCVSA